MRETDRDAKPLLIDDSDDSSFKLDESVNESAGSTSCVSDVTHESLFPVMSTSPPTQVMDKNEGYDPTRLPSSMFGSKPATPSDWSMASNDSLFSIQIGNKSGELFKSGEFHKPEHLYSTGLKFFGEQKSSNERVKIRELSFAELDPHTKRNINDERKTKISGATDETKKNVYDSHGNDHGELDVEAPKKSSTKHQADGNGTSGHSSAFPTERKKKKKKKKMCACLSFHCSNCSCSRPNCHCKRSCCSLPSCNCKRSCCSWPSCHCKRSCCSWPSCPCKRSCCSGKCSNCCSWKCSNCCSCKCSNCCSFKWLSSCSWKRLGCCFCK